MEDGAISDSPPETSTGRSRGLWQELAPRLVPSAGRAGRVGDVCDHDSVDGARVAISLFRGCRDYPPLGGTFPRLLPAGLRLTRSWAARDGLAASKTGEASMPRAMIG